MLGFMSIDEGAFHGKLAAGCRVRQQGKLAGREGDMVGCGPDPDECLGSLMADTQARMGYNNL